VVPGVTIPAALPPEGGRGDLTGYIKSDR
jgi:hypothetical protein